MEAPSQSNARTSLSEKKRNHSITGNKKGRPRNEYGKSKKSDDRLLEKLHREFEQYLSDKLAKMGQDVER